MKKDTFFYLLLLLLVGGAFLIGKNSVEKQVLEIIKTDTLTVKVIERYDSLIYEKEDVIKPIYIPVRDTVTMHDTTYIVLNRVQREYSDTSFHAWVSGYEPKLDSIHIFSKTQYITTTITEKEPPKRWHVGVVAGYGAGKDGFSPYFGIGVTYSLFAF